MRIQAELKAPKSQYNNFSHFYFRNCEDILEALKPHLKNHELTLVLNDEVVAVGSSNYVKTTATLCDGADVIETSAWAREPISRKGMDDSQITGATSSYARKYALNGLFAIDDTKDADTADNRPKEVARPQVPKLDELTTLKEEIRGKFMEKGMTKDVEMQLAIRKVIQKVKIETVEEANGVLQAIEDGVL